MARKSHPVETFATGERLRWDVRWVIKVKGRWHVIVKPFGDDLQGAIEMYLRVKARGRALATLRCRNSGFPPPENLRPYWYKKKVKKQVRRKGRLRTITAYEDKYRVPMRRQNREGKWWCPYCRELREFVREYELPYKHPPVGALGQLDPMPTERGLYCPMCLVSTRDHNVRKHNPIAERIT